MVDRIRYPTVSYLPFYYIFFFEIDFQFLLLTIFNLQANILTTKDILSNLAVNFEWEKEYHCIDTRGVRGEFSSVYIYIYIYIHQGSKS